MKNFLTVILLVFITLFYGCKAKIVSELNVSDILKSETKIMKGDIYVEVITCHAFNDSRQPSQSVIRAKRNIPNIFLDAKYIECVNKQFKSQVHFTIPVILNKNKSVDLDKQIISGSYINIVSNKAALLGFIVPKKIRDGIDALKRNSFDNTVDLQVNIKVNNDTKEKFSFIILSAFIDKQPYIIESLSVNGKSSFLITLSDVTVSSALNKGFIIVLKRTNIFSTKESK